MKRALLLVVLATLFAATPAANAQSLRVENAEIVARLTGPGAINDTLAVKVGGTDLGHMANLNGKTYFLFGDTFSGDQPGDGDWRWNVMSYSSDPDPSDGITFDGWITDWTGMARQVIRNGYTNPVTEIPTGAVTIGNRIYAWYMVVGNWNGWQLDYAGLAYWQEGFSQFNIVNGFEFPGNSNFGMVAASLRTDPDGADDPYLYLWGTPGGRAGGVKLARVHPANITNRASYQYFGGWDDAEPLWINDEFAAPYIINPTAGEMSVMYNHYAGAWTIMYLNANAGAIELRHAPKPWGPWSDPATVATGQQHPGIYGSYMNPLYVENDGQTIYFTISLWGPYDVYLMKADIVKEDPPAGTVAYYRFEDGADELAVPKPFGITDSSGNGNHIDPFDESGAGFRFYANAAAPIIPQTGAPNALSVKNIGLHPASTTGSATTNPAGVDIETITPLAWTVEASFKIEDYPDSTTRTLVGRDSYGLNTAPGGDPARASFYLQVTETEALAVRFTDVSGYYHQALSAPALVRGFNWWNDPDGNTVPWYHLAAVSDGDTLALYLAQQGQPYQIVAQTDLTASNSPDRRLSAGAGTQHNVNWGHAFHGGAWTLGRSLYDAYHSDRMLGYLDEIRISNLARPVHQFLASDPPRITADPQDTAVKPGQSATFTITVESSAPAHYQWKKLNPAGNDLNVGADSPTLAILNASATDDGLYYCQVTANALTVSSAHARLTVQRLMGHWTMDNTLADASPENHPGRYRDATDPLVTNAGAIFGPGRLNDALVLTRSEDRFVEIENSHDAYEFWPRGFTVSTWVKTTHGGAYQCLASKQHRVDGQDWKGWILDLTPAGQLQFQLRGLGGAGSGGIALNDGQWHLVTATFDAHARTLHTYLDGILVETAGPFDSPPLPNNEPMRLGSETAAGATLLHGMLDEAAIYNYPLSEVEVAYLLHNVTGQSVCIASARPNPAVDLNADCIVDLRDLVMLLPAWLDCGRLPQCVQ